jgi:hypothetical protein
VRNDCQGVFFSLRDLFQIISSDCVATILVDIIGSIYHNTTIKGNIKRL